LVRAAAGLTNLTVATKKLFLIYSLVFYCVLIDENESIKSQRSVEDRKTKEKVIHNVVFLSLKFYYKSQDAIGKKKGKQHKPKVKGKTVPFIFPQKFIKFKQSSLQGVARKRKGKQNRKVGKLIESILIFSLNRLGLTFVDIGLHVAWGGAKPSRVPPGVMLDIDTMAYLLKCALN
jgi:hypothetical protein